MSTTAARRSIAANEEWAVPGKAPHNVARLRPRQLCRLFRRRHGRTYPFDDEGLRDRDIVLDSIVQSGVADAYQQATTFLNECCPWTPVAEHPAVIERAVRRRKFWDKSELGNVLGLTWEERTACEITTIRPAGATDADMDAHSKMQDAARQREKRRQATLHPKEKLLLPAVRAHAIAGFLRMGEKCTVSALCAELKRTKQFRFARLERKALATAVHSAIAYGVEHGFFRKHIDRSGRWDVAWVTKIGNAQ